MSRLRFLAAASSTALALAVFGCGGSDEPYYIPADHEIRPFTPPDEEELTADEAGAPEEAAELDDWGESGTEEPRPSSEPPAAAPAPASAPAQPGKAAKPAKAARPAAAGMGSESRSQ